MKNKCAKFFKNSNEYYQRSNLFSLGEDIIAEIQLRDGRWVPSDKAFRLDNGQYISVEDAVRDGHAVKRPDGKVLPANKPKARSGGDPGAGLVRVKPDSSAMQAPGGPGGRSQSDAGLVRVQPGSGDIGRPNPQNVRVEQIHPPRPAALPKPNPQVAQAIAEKIENSAVKFLNKRIALGTIGAVIAAAAAYKLLFDKDAQVAATGNKPDDTVAAGAVAVAQKICRRTDIDGETKLDTSLSNIQKIAMNRKVKTKGQLSDTYSKISEMARTLRGRIYELRKKYGDKIINKEIAKNISSDLRSILDGMVDMAKQISEVISKDEGMIDDKLAALQAELQTAQNLIGTFKNTILKDCIK
jgi:hypothetical protein